MPNTEITIHVPEKYDGWVEILSNLSPVEPMLKNNVLDINAYTVAAVGEYVESHGYADRIVPENVVISDILNRIETLLDDKIGNEWGSNAEVSTFINSLDSHLCVNGEEVYSWDDVCNSVEKFENDSSAEIGALVRKDPDCIEKFSTDIEQKNSQIRDLVHHIGVVLLESVEEMTAEEGLATIKHHSDVFNDVFATSMSKEEANTPF
jgi:antitoxin component HigA of HigAB toxin-antitoxin module